MDTFSLYVVALSAVAVAGVITALLPWLRKRALAIPNQRSSHCAPTPQGGGVAIVLVFLAGAALSWGYGYAQPPSGLLHAGAVVLGAIGLMLVGLLDDLNSVSIKSRMVVQSLAALALVLTLPDGVRILPGAIPLLAERAILVVSIVWFINIVNFMDGLDWISAVETVFVMAGIMALAFFQLIPSSLGWYAAGMLGAMVGFMPYNAPTARLFLGDAGSLPLGFIMAALLIHVASSGAWAAAAILPMYHVADASITLVRRLTRGEKPWEAHREHFYQRAMRRGLSVWRILAYVALLNAALLVLAVTASASPSLVAQVTALALAAALVALTLRKFSGIAK